MQTAIIRKSEFDEKIDSIAEKMLGMEQAYCPVRHIFGDGIYIREVTLKAGTVAIGHYQKTIHVNVMLKGRLTMVNPDGSHTELVAPMTYIGQPGRKVGYIHEETVWQNIYATSETDVSKLEAMYLEKSEVLKSHLRIVKQDTGYAGLLDEIGVAAETVTAQSENEADQCTMPWGAYKFAILDSDIHGKGLMASSDIAVGEIIGAARIAGMRTPVGRFTNHSDRPNAAMVNGNDGVLYLVAIKPIKGNDGGFSGEEITCDYRQSLRVR